REGRQRRGQVDRLGAGAGNVEIDRIRGGRRIGRQDRRTQTIGTRVIGVEYRERRGSQTIFQQFQSQSNTLPILGDRARGYTGWQSAEEGGQRHEYSPKEWIRRSPWARENPGAEEPKVLVIY